VAEIGNTNRLYDTTKHFDVEVKWDIPVFLVDPRGTNPSTHRIFITETNDKKLKVQHDDKDVIVDVTTPPPPRKIKKIYIYIFVQNVIEVKYTDVVQTRVLLRIPS
jgi:hypothetical protein